MKLPVQGIDVSRTSRLFPATKTDVPLHPMRSFSNISRKNVEIVSDDVLDEDLVTTSRLGSRPPARMRLSVSTKSRYEPMEYEQTIVGEGPMLSERRRSLFEPLGPKRSLRDRSPENLLPPPDFEAASYPRGWVVGKKRKLVNVDVVESMRRIAVHEMNRKDREIDGLTEQLEEDSRTMEHLQLQLQQERQKRSQTERENSVLQGQVSMLMDMLNEVEEGEEAENMDDSQVINN